MDLHNVNFKDYKSYRIDLQNFIYYVEGGEINNIETTCFYGIIEQLGRMWKWKFTKMAISLVAFFSVIKIFPILRNGYSFWLVLILFLWILGPLIASFIYKKEATFDTIKTSMRYSLLGSLQDCEFLEQYKNIKNQIDFKIVYANILYIAGHFVVENENKKQFFEKAINLLNDYLKDFHSGNIMFFGNRLLFLTDLYLKAHFLFDIKIKTNEFQINDILHVFWSRMDEIEKKAIQKNIEAFDLEKKLEFKIITE